MERRCVWQSTRVEKNVGTRRIIKGNCVEFIVRKREKLPVNPNKKQNEEKKLKNHEKSIEEYKSDGKGDVILTKMRMMKGVELKKGYMNVFPNYLHGKRKDGLGLPELSPKDMGPIEHGQPGLPVALNLENFHQGNKVFKPEVSGGKFPNFNILKRFFDTQKKMYMDPIPHRHKEEAKGKNVPLCSIWVDKKKKIHQISYFESRQFYCNFYERIALKSEGFKKLKELLKDGYNLNICGYDAYEITVDDVEKAYLDISKPFGHELVLFTLLMCKKNQYPWRKYKTFDF